jgi:uncharacterized membrane protein
MKQCTVCYRTYVDESLSFCTEDGGQLVGAGQTTPPAGQTAPPAGPGTGYYAEVRDTSAAPTQVFSAGPMQGAPNSGYGAAVAPASGPKTATGLEPNIEALLAYVMTFVSGLIFFLLEKDDRYVRFHSMQAIIFGGAFFVLMIAFTFIKVMLSLMGLGLLNILIFLFQALILLGFFLLWILCMVKAYQGQTFKLPVIGQMAASIVDKQSL